MLFGYVLCGHVDTYKNTPSTKHKTNTTYVQVNKSTQVNTVLKISIITVIASCAVYLVAFTNKLSIRVQEFLVQHRVKNRVGVMVVVRLTLVVCGTLRNTILSKLARI